MAANLTRKLCLASMQPSVPQQAVAQINLSCCSGGGDTTPQNAMPTASGE
jgi:hypothetical protein